MSTAPHPIGTAEWFRRLASFHRAAFGEISTCFGDALRRMAGRRSKREPELSAIHDEEYAVQSAMSGMWFCILGGSRDVPGGVDDFLRLGQTLIGRRIAAKACAERADKRILDPSLRRFAEYRFLDCLNVEQFGLGTGPIVAARGRGIGCAGTTHPSNPSKI